MSSVLENLYIYVKKKIGVPNMPQNTIIECSDGTDPRGPLPACLPMNFNTWYI
jgi:hypothetical protein